MYKIYYMDSFPGAGKTTEAIKYSCEQLKGKTGIIFYVAPTVALLKQFRDNVLNLDPSLRGHLRLVKSAETLFAGGVTPTNNQVINILCGGKDRAKLVYGVVMLTHEAFINLKTVPRQEEITVIFDEARKFSTTLKGVKLRSDREVKIFNDLVERHSSPVTYIRNGVPVNSNYVHLQLDDGQGRLDGITTKNGLAQFKELNALISTARNKRLSVYVKRSKANNRFTFYQVVAPGKIFIGYKRVILMAAYLKDSQMWALLKATPNISLISINAIHPEISGALQVNSVNILNRFSQVTIFPIMANEDLISKIRLHSGVLVDTEHYGEVASALLKLGIKSNQALSILAGKSEEPDEWLLTESEKKAIEVLSNPKYGVETNAMTWLLEKSKYIVRDLKKKGKVIKRPLVVVNEDFAELTREHGPFNAVRISMASQGLNYYKEHNTMVFIAANNPRPDMATLYKCILPSYDYMKDHIADTCIQCFTRLSVRRTDCVDNTYVILPDGALTNMLQFKFKGYATIDGSYAQKFNKSFLTFDASRESPIPLAVRQVENARRLTKKLRAKDYGRRLLYLRSARSMYRKRIEQGLPKNLDKARDRLARIETELQGIEAIHKESKRQEKANRV